MHDSPALEQIRRGLRLRTLRSVLSFACIATVLFANQSSALEWAGFVATSLAWPSIAEALALCSRDPKHSESCALLIDAAIGGVWVALMQFNVLPSVLLTVLLASDRVMAGGWSLLARGVLVQIATCILTLAVHGFAFTPQTSLLQAIITLPLLIGYPLAAGGIHAGHMRRAGNAGATRTRYIPPSRPSRGPA